MNIHEYQAKAILKNFNVPVPKGEILFLKIIFWKQPKMYLIIFGL